MRIDGKEIAGKILQDLQKEIKILKEKNIIPHLVIVLVGNDPASSSYVRQKRLKGERIGAKITVVNLESRIENLELLSIIQQFNNDNNVHGIIVQRPLPKTIDSQKIDQAIDPKKDVDSFNTHSFYEMPLSTAVLYILEHIFSSNIKNEHNFDDWLKTKRIVVIGKGETGGKPIIEMLEKLGIKPTVIDSKTNNPQLITKQADIIISAVGKPNIITPEKIKKGIILISIGLHRENDGKLHGDYEENQIKDIASFYTPNPGGIGPINVAMLLMNLIEATENSS